ncbi:serine recombinase [Bacillus aerolatus]|uniref:Serine recombinase n=1 Tax=Bacillus aerolatus TaxID=2653354 RepID=A0A6I1FC93_9BACI|nr:recombinase family protein [Bacillus aerolatus]KAB7704912.1 serine recombinase [Bacillus aerolatus]
MGLNNVIAPGMKAAFYGRHSTDKQNMDTQLRSAYDFANHYQCKIIGEYLDEAVSSRRKERKGLEALIRDAAEQKFDFIIIYSASRLARIPKEHDTLRTTMNILGIHIVESSTETLYSYGDIVYSSIKDALAKYEMDKIRASTRDSIKTLLNMGLWTGGRAPFGYKYHPKLSRTGEKDNSEAVKEFTKHLPIEDSMAIQRGKFEIIDHELILAKRVFSLYKDGYGFQQIAEKMPAKSYRGKNWDKNKVKQIIINPFYSGVVAIRKRNPSSRSSLNDREDWLMNKNSNIQPIISFNEWEECFRIYEQRKEKRLPPNYYKTSFLLANLLFCKTCDQELKGKDQRSKGYGKRIYICNGCGFKVSIDDVHQEVMNLFLKMQTKTAEQLVKTVQEKILKDCYEMESNIAVISNALEQEKQKLFNLNEKIEKMFSSNGDETIIKLLNIGKETLLASIQDKTSQISQLEKSIKVLKDIDANEELIKDKMMDFKRLVELPKSKIRRIYLYFIERIYVEPPGRLECKFRINLEEDV